MTVVRRSCTVPYTCEEMFHLVDNIEVYDEFLPYFSHSEVHYRSEDEVQATLTVAAGGMKKAFTTRNLLQKNKMIELRLVDGPFKHLEGFWRFDAIATGCHLSFDLEFEFSNRMLAMVLNPIFEQITDKMVDVFCKRAEEVYGQR